MDSFFSSVLTLFLNYIDKNIHYVILAAVVGIIICRRLKPNYKLPPGPIGLPLFGYYPFLGGNSVYRKLHQLTLKYGPIFSFYLGSQLVVVVGSFKTAKEALTNKDIMDRPKNPANNLLPNSRGFTTFSGDIWKEQKQFSMKLLRQLGMGKQRMEDIIQDEIRRLLENFCGHEETPINIESSITASVSNNIYVLLTGQRLDFHSEERKFINDFLNVLHVYFKPTGIHAVYPFTKYWLSKLKIWGYNRVHEVMSGFEKLMNSKVTKCKRNYQEDNTENYIVGYLKNMDTRTNSSFSEKMLRGNLMSLLGAGSSPPAVTAEWAIALMVRFPEIQRKVHEEIDSVVDFDRLPKSDDQKSMPYTTAVLMEVQRYVSVIPISITRSATRSTKLYGYDVPKGTWMITNIWGVHHHPDSWSEPEIFNPDRFLQNGEIVKHPALIPFSYGTRSCPGADLGNQLIFLYFTSILQSYTVAPAKSIKCTFSEFDGFVRLIFPEVCLLPRKPNSNESSVV